MALLTATAAVLALNPSGYLKLNDGSGSTAAAIVGSAGTYVGSPTLSGTGRVQPGTPTAGGTGATCLTTASGKYLNLGTLSGLMAAVLGSGATICFWYNAATGLGTSNLYGGFEGASTQGISLVLGSGGGGSDRLTLTVKDNAGNTFSRRYNRPFCPIFGGQWMHVAMRIKLTQGASSSTGTLEVVLNGTTLAIDAANWSDVAADAVVGAISELSTGKFLLGNVQTGATPGTAMAADFQEVAWFPALLTNAQILSIMGGGTWDGTIGAPDPLADFDLTDISRMYQDTAGTVPVTAAGQEVLRVNAVVGPLYLQGTAGRSAIWNGAELELDNRLASAASTTRGMEVMNMAALPHLRQMWLGMAAVVQPVSQVINNASDQFILHLTGTGAGATMTITSDGQYASLAGATVGVTKTPVTPAGFPLCNCLPSSALVAVSFGANGNGATTAANTNLSCMVGSTVSSDNTNFGDTTRKTATNGAYYNPLTGGWFGIGGAPGANGGSGGANYATAATFKARRLCLYGRPLNPTAEMPGMLAVAAATHSDLANTEVDQAADLYVVGDSTSSTQQDDGSPAVSDEGSASTLLGWQSRLSPAVKRRLRVVNISQGTYQISQQTPRVTARMAVGCQADEAKRVMVIYLGTNDITQNQSLATIQTRFTALFAAAKTALGNGCKVGVFTINTSGAVSGSGATPAQVNAWLATQEGTAFDKLLANPNDAALHPDGDGQQALADVVDAWLRQAVPSLVDGSLKRMRPHWLRRVEW